jgi:hypothetical protein
MGVSIPRRDSRGHSDPDLALLKAQQLRIFDLDHRLLARFQVAQVRGVQASRRALHHDRCIARVYGCFIALGGLLLLHHGSMQAVPADFSVQSQQRRAPWQWKGVNRFQVVCTRVAVVLTQLHAQQEAFKPPLHVSRLQRSGLAIGASQLGRFGVAIGVHSFSLFDSSVLAMSW